ncbi:hypothetical protein ES703_91915 [subsurface metagenome]
MLVLCLLTVGCFLCFFWGVGCWWWWFGVGLVVVLWWFGGGFVVVWWWFGGGLVVVWWWWFGGGPSFTFVGARRLTSAAGLFGPGRLQNRFVEFFGTPGEME